MYLNNSVIYFLTYLLTILNIKYTVAGQCFLRQQSKAADQKIF